MNTDLSPALATSADATLGCTPVPRLVTWERASRAIAAAFAQSDAAGLLHLATVALKDELDAPLAWARAWGRQFFARLCQTRDPAATEPPPAEARLALLAEAPPMRGAEYLCDALLLRLWEDLRALVAAEAAASGLEGWLRERSALWHLVGRVTFHLAENKRNEQQPFAFLATYTDQLSAAVHRAVMVLTRCRRLLIKVIALAMKSGSGRGQTT